MSLKNVLIIVDNIDVSIDFYEELFGLRVITRQEGNQKMSIFANRKCKLLTVKLL